MTLGIGVGAFAKSGVGVWAERANRETGSTRNDSHSRIKPRNARGR